MSRSPLPSSSASLSSMPRCTLATSNPYVPRRATHAALFAALMAVTSTSVAAQSPTAKEPPTATPAATPSIVAPTVAGPTAAPQAPLPYKLITAPADAAAKVDQPAAPIQPKDNPAASTTVAAPPAAVTQPANPAIAPAQAAVPPTSAPKPPATTLRIDIDLTRQRMTLSEYGKQVGSWPISSGAEGYRSPTGTYRPIWQSKMWYSKKYDNAPMPHAIFFSGGVAMHATQSIAMLGRPASHGCIRQSPANAATTYKLVTKHGNAHTRIVVHGTAPQDAPRIARREQPSAMGRIAARDIAPQRAIPMRRVMLVDAYGNRRITNIPANDPRLFAYQSRDAGPGWDRRRMYRNDW